MVQNETLPIACRYNGNLNKTFCIKYLTQMNPINDWKHQVLQRLIIVFLGLLTLGVVVQSCKTNHSSCAAYDKVELPKN